MYTSMEIHLVSCNTKDIYIVMLRGKKMNAGGHKEEGVSPN